MPIEIKVPSVGESITSGILGVWSKPDGSYVKTGEPIFEIETDKVTSEIVAESSGQLKHLVKAGDTVKIGQVVASIDEKAKAPAETEPKKEATTKKEVANGTVTAPARTAAAAPVATSSARGKNADDLSPAVRYQTEEKGIDPASIKGTGKDGRILKGDVLAVENVEKTSSPSASPKQASASTGERTSRRKMTPLRQKIAARLLSAQQETAHLTTFNEVDLSNIIALRTKFQDRFVKKYETKLGFMSFFVKAVVHALQIVPAINARLDGDEVVQNHFYDLGVAISTEKGLLVPVVRDADKLSFAEVEKTIAAYAKKARDGKITLTDLEGGVFTITNGGVFGSLLSTPILNPPQCGILGMHTIQDRPVAIAGRVEIRPMMYLALTYDHRLVDGREAVTFLAHIKEVVENPAAVLLEV